jgi:hypothetical protein
MPVNGPGSGKKRVAPSSDAESADGNVNGHQADESGETSPQRRRIRGGDYEEEESEEERPVRPTTNGHHVNGNVKPTLQQDEDGESEDASGEDDEEGLEVEEGQVVRTQRPAAPMQTLVRHENGQVHFVELVVELNHRPHS